MGNVNAACCGVFGARDKEHDDGRVRHKDGHQSESKLLKTLAIVLKFIYTVRVKVKVRKYVLNEAKLLTLENAENDRIGRYWF